MTSRAWIVVLGLLATSVAVAQSVPTAINYQGRLTDNSPGQNPIDATLAMEFRIYGSAMAADLLWSEVWPTVDVHDGIFSVMLGTNGSPVPTAVFEGGGDRYLEVVVSGEVLTPRQRLGSVGFAHQAETSADSNQLGGLAASEYVQVGGSYMDPAFIQSLAGAKISGAVASADAAIDFTGPLAGDVQGMQGSTSVTGIQGNPVSALVPSANSVLAYDGVSWLPDSTPSLDGLSLPDGSLSPSVLSPAAGVLAGEGFFSVTSTLPAGTYGNLAYLEVTTPGPGTVKVDAYGYAYLQVSNCTATVGLATTPTATPTRLLYVQDSSTMKQSGYPSVTAYGGVGDGTSVTFPWTIGYEITPSFNIVVYGTYSKRGSWVRVWRDSDQLLVMSQFASPGGSWETNYVNKPVLLRAGVKYIVTIDVTTSGGYEWDNSPYSSVGETYLVMGNGRWISSAATFPTNSSASTRYGGVGLLHYRVPSIAKYVPAAISRTFSVPGAGTYTYYLNGRKLENESEGGTCSFATSGMTYVFSPTLGP